MITKAKGRKGRPPFNEFSVLFLLLSLYAAGSLALRIADFVLKSDFDLPEDDPRLGRRGGQITRKDVADWLGASDNADTGHGLNGLPESRHISPYRAIPPPSGT